jgi:hypothetical protein
MDWTDEADAMLRKLWEAGGTLTTVARDMATAGYTFSRNAISGRKWRLAKDQSFVRTEPVRKISPRPRARGTPMNIASKQQDFETEIVVREEPADGVNYLDNTEAGCKAILDKIGTDGLRMCCGRTRSATGSPYCPTHHRLYNNLQPAALRKSHG